MNQKTGDKKIKECLEGCAYSMNSKCEVLSVDPCGCETHQKSVYFSDFGYRPDKPVKILCRTHQPTKLKRGVGWCNRCGSYCYGDCRYADGY
jgi:hypothetical protein